MLQPDVGSPKVAQLLIRLLPALALVVVALAILVLAVR